MGAGDYLTVGSDTKQNERNNDGTGSFGASEVDVVLTTHAVDIYQWYMLYSCQALALQAEREGRQHSTDTSTSDSMQ